MSNSTETNSTEEVGYYISRDWPKSRQPSFFDVEPLPGTQILRENYARIKEEILAYYAERAAEIEPNFTPYARDERGWKTVNLYSYFLRYPQNCARFPVVDEVVRQIPGMCLAQIAVLDPQTKIFAHFGDSNIVIRSHLGISVPGGLPELGIRVGREDRCWKEGDVLAISIAQRHYAWNYTERHRLVLVVDVIRPDLFERRFEVASNVMAVIAMKWFATRFPATKGLPKLVTTAIRVPLSWPFRLRLWLQRVRGV